MGGFTPFDLGLLCGFCLAAGLFGCVALLRRPSKD